MLFRIALSNAVAAAAIALIAAAAGLLFRRPAVTHGLWLLVLLKLVSPPLWLIPLHLPAAQPAASGPIACAPTVGEAPAIPIESERASTSTVDSMEPSLDAKALIPLRADTKPLPSAPKRVHEHLDLHWVPAAAVVIWLAGTVICAFIGIGRIVQFRRFTLRYAEPAPPSLQRRARLLSNQLGIRTCPQVLVIPGALSPMLWAVGDGARILVPRQLLARLDDYQRAMLLAHELAHLRRGDHWVRYLELLATCLYWWNPIVWVARRAIREAGEQCCDAWVLWLMPGAFRSYAAALLDTIEFLSGPGSSVPALACGLGQFRQLKRRLIMLKQGRVSKALTWTGFAGLCGAAALLLPLAPTWGQKADRPSEEQIEQQQARAEEQAERAQAQEEKAQAEREAAQERAEADAEKHQAETEALGERARAQAEQAVQAAQEQVGNVLARAKEAIAQAAQRDDNDNENDNTDRGRGRNRDELRQAVKEAQQQVERAVEMAKRQVAQAIREASHALSDAQKQARDAQREAMRSRQQRDGSDADLRRQLEDAHRQIRELSQRLAQGEQRMRDDQRRGRRFDGQARPDGPSQDGNGPASDRDERLSRLEKQLQALMNEVKSLEQNRDQPRKE